MSAVELRLSLYVLYRSDAPQAILKKDTGEELLASLSAATAYSCIVADHIAVAGTVVDRIVAGTAGIVAGRTAVVVDIAMVVVVVVPRAVVAMVLARRVVEVDLDYNS